MGSGVIVMYRAIVDGEWQPWVSNADPEWMRFAKSKYGLQGTLNEAGTYAGAEEKNIEGIEIRIYEDDSTDAGAGSFVGTEKDSIYKEKRKCLIIVTQKRQKLQFIFNK